MNSAQASGRSTDPVHLRHARLRLSRGAERSSSNRYKSASSILSMVDLLSCAFGGALFLFMLTSAPSDAVPSSPPAATQSGLMVIEVDSRIARPIFLFKQMPGGPSFVVDGSKLDGTGFTRRVLGSSTDGTKGKVTALGFVPWDAEPAAPLPPLRLMFENPAKDWCLRVGLQGDDTSTRQRMGNEIKADGITISLLRPGAAQTVELFSDISWPLDQVGISDCMSFSF